VRHLARLGVRIQLVDLPEWGPARLPEAQRDPWFETLAAPVGARAALHFCMPHQVERLADTLTVNYTMFEATRIPPSWVRHNRSHDLVVLPTESSRQAWRAGGLPADRIRLCPLGVDATRFRPGLDPLPLVDRRGRDVGSYRTRLLNVSELGPRKNLAALVRVWLRATRADDDAVLIIKAGRWVPGMTRQLVESLDAVERQLGKKRSEAASLLVFDQLLADAEMPRLYAAATHYLSLSHGEGWDQPMMEAGVSGLHLIAPEHSAYTAYLDRSVARLIPSRQVPVPPEAGLPAFFQGAEWWDPDEDAAVGTLRAVIDQQDDTGLTARARLAPAFSWEQAAARLVDILAELHDRHGLAF
jgi:glycosyltransferase involved in cell wall biosynthesis